MLIVLLCIIWIIGWLTTAKIAFHTEKDLDAEVAITICAILWPLMLPIVSFMWARPKIVKLLKMEKK